MTMKDPFVSALEVTEHYFFLFFHIWHIGLHMEKTQTNNEMEKCITSAKFFKQCHSDLRIGFS